jgi:pimeloyl-ACP methyl ester carboxylesterase
MSIFGRASVLLLLFTTACTPGPAAEAERGGSPEAPASSAVPPRMTGSETYRMYHPDSDVEAVLVLLPGFGGGVASYELESGVTPSTLPAALAARGVLTVVATPTVGTLYETDQSVRALDDLLVALFDDYAIGPVPVAMGGFSAGGTGALRYAQACVRNACRAVSRVAAVFGVDPPLDFERLYRSSRLSMERGAPRTNVAEERMILQMLEESMGGPPEQARAAYLRSSVVLASEADGGNAPLLRSTPTRLYTEADVQWWLDERNLDFHGMNAVDHAALINLLRVAGNEDAELIVTTGKGYRPDGQRHPHSWSIVDETELIEWLMRALLPGS